MLVAVTGLLEGGFSHPYCYCKSFSLSDLKHEGVSGKHHRPWMREMNLDSPRATPTGPPPPVTIQEIRVCDLPMAKVVKNPPAMQETQETGSIPRSGRPLEEEMATHSSILAWKIPWTEKPGGL